MSVRSVLSFAKKSVTSRPISAFRTFSSLPESFSSESQSFAFPNEYPGQNYAFNWCLNGDGVTPLHKSAFRILKPLDVQIAGLKPLTTVPLSVNATAAKKTMLEAGSEDLEFEPFDEMAQKVKDMLSDSKSLFCPEGYMPGTDKTVRVITNSADLAPKLSAYLTRAPKRDPVGCNITAYVLESNNVDAFAAYAIEEVGEGSDGIMSVAAVVCSGKKVKVEQVVAGLELSLDGLKFDEEARKVEAEAKAKN